MPKRDLFASSSSEDEDDGGELARQMATAAAREQRRDPHAYAPFAGLRKKEKTLAAAAAAAVAAREEALTSSSSDDEEETITSQKAEAKVAFTGKKKAGGKKSREEEVEEEKKNEDKDGIHINKQYAAKYEEVKRRKELQLLTQKYGGRIRHDSDEDEEDEEDDEALLLTESKELSFAKAFLAIRQAAKKKRQQEEVSTSAPPTTKGGGDAKKSDSNDGDPLGAPSAFFPPPEEQERENAEVFMRAVEMKRQQRKKFTLADEYSRGVITGVEGSINDDGDGQAPQGNRRIQPQSAKERRLRDSFLQSVAESTETFDVQPAAGTSNQQQGGSSAALSEAKRLLVGAFSIRNAETTANAPEADADEADPDEAFLRDFFVEELWKPENAKKRKAKQKSSKTTEAQESGDEGSNSGSGNGDGEDAEGDNYAALAELAQAEADERFYADAEVWEREFQDRAYRHQEEAADHVQSFPRAIGEHAEGLLRKSATSSRKEARLRRLQRMEELRAQQVAELRRLKTLKRQEIEAQRSLIASVAGITKSSNSSKKKKKGNKMTAEAEEDAEVARLQALWSEKDLEEDYDPQKFDKKMAELFDDAYYNEKNVDEEEMAFFEDEEDAGEEDGAKSEGGEEEEEDVPALYTAGSLEEARAMTAASKNREVKKNELSGKKQPQQEGHHVGGDVFNDDALALLYPSAAIRAAESASFEGRREQLEHMIQQQQQRKDGDGDNSGTLEQLQAELAQKEQEYWQLHHDSTLGGGTLKTRFKYREVAPEDFTLSVEEILSRDDRQLNMLVPMSCYAAYLGTEANRRDRMKTQRRRQQGFREVEPTRSSRRYGDVSKTALVDTGMTEEEGRKWAEQVHGGLRRLREAVGGDEDDNNNNDVEAAAAASRDEEQQRGVPYKKRPRHEGDGRGGLQHRGEHQQQRYERGGMRGRGRGGSRGRGRG
ncbi:protein KRI1 [Trypanosoma grayi]|uniref:protein KRI1 n=1 Tax=Trypanosoma grayi TaxID=71804 RepID=UPI0004F4573E|nr:protein KRI1 [Trypanosoma grayi]KEG11530.1 protein KRI1 [Trypanosoma grayi]